MRKILFSVMATVLAFSLLPNQILAQTQETAPDETLHFVMTVQWGNVQGPINSQETMFDGSIFSNDSTTRISLLRTLRFENHNSDRDKITKETTPVTWQSLIYGGWDGVKVLVSAHASSTITVDIPQQGTITKTASELANLTEPVVVNAANDREIVIKTHPYENRQFFLDILWGDGPVGQKADFSGSLTLTGGSEMKLMRTLRFEGAQGDKVTTQSLTSINWQSTIVGGRDGLLNRVRFDKVVNDTDTLTINFPNWSKTYRLLDLYHNRVTKEEMNNVAVTPCADATANEEGTVTTCQTTGQQTTSARPYHLVIAVKRFPNRSLVKVGNRSAVYMVEDGTVRPVLSASAFLANGLNWKDIESIDQEELDSYAVGEPLNYPDGTLVKGTGSTIYVIADGKKRPIGGPSVFARLGYKWNWVQKISDAELAQFSIEIPVTSTSTYPEGTILREKGKNVFYVIEGGEKKLVGATEAVAARGQKWEKAIEISKTILNKISSSGNIYPDGTLIKGKNAAIYLIDHGRKRLFKSARDFIKGKYQWGKIKTLSDQEVSAIPTGDEMVVED